MNGSSTFYGSANLRTILEYEHLTKVQAAFDEEMMTWQNRVKHSDIQCWFRKISRRYQFQVVDSEMEWREREGGNYSNNQYN